MTSLNRPAGTSGEIRVLVLDDDLLMMSMYRMFLPRLLPGHKFTVTDNGVQALADYEGQQYEVVVTDLNMIHMSGLEFFKRVRKQCLTSGSSVPRFIFCSGVSKALAEVRAFLADESPLLLQKPFDISRLVEMIDGK